MQHGLAVSRGGYFENLISASLTTFMLLLTRLMQVTVLESDLRPDPAHELRQNCRSQQPSSAAHPARRSCISGQNVRRYLTNCARLLLLKNNTWRTCTCRSVPRRRQGCRPAPRFSWSNRQQGKRSKRLNIFALSFTTSNAGYPRQVFQYAGSHR